MRRKHQHGRFQHGLLAQRYVNGHLVTVKVGVESRTNERVQLNGFALDELGLERLNTETVQGRGAVQQHRVAFQHVFQNIPNHGILAVHNFLGRFYGLDNTTLDQLADDERLEQFRRHVLRKTALVQFQFGTHHDHRTTGVVHTLTEQVLTETALLAFQHIRERFEGAVAFRTHGVHFPAVVEERIHGFLQHPLLVAQNYLGRFDFDQTLQAVVANDDAAVQIVQVGSRETTTIEGYQRTQLGRNDGYHLDDHPLGTVLDAGIGITECLDHFQTLQSLLLALLRRIGRGLVAQFVRKLVQFGAGQQHFQCVGAHLGDELLRIGIGQHLVLAGEFVDDVQVLVLCQEVHVADAVLGLHARLYHGVALVVNDLIQLLGG